MALEGGWAGRVKLGLVRCRYWRAGGWVSNVLIAENGFASSLFVLRNGRHACLAAFVVDATSIYLEQGPFNGTMSIHVCLSRLSADATAGLLRAGDR